MAPQLPAGDAVFLDHLAHFVADMGAASAALERLGFEATPLTLQETEQDGARVPAGTANRCVMLAEGYLEILTAVSDTPLAAQLRDAIGRYEGVHLIAFSTADAHAAHARLTATGLPVQAPVHLRRPLPEGSGEAAFTVIRLQPGAMPEGRIQFLQHHTPELLWSPPSTRQANGTSGLESVLLCVEDARESTARFEAFLGRPPSPLGGGFLIALERGVVAIVEPDALAALLPETGIPSLPCIALYALHGHDVSESRTFLASRGIQATEIEPGLTHVTLPPPLSTTVTIGERGRFRGWIERRLGGHARHA